MYIIELIAKLSTKIKNRDFKFLKKQNSQQNEVVEEQSCKIKKQNPFEQ